MTQIDDNRRKRTLAVPSGLTRRATLAAAGSAVAAPLIGRHARAAGEPIVIGCVGPLSPPGGYAEGTLMKDAILMAADEINAKGGVIGRPLQIVVADTRGMPAEGRTAALRLVQENKIVAAVGEFHSPVALAEMEVFHQYGIPFMACDVWSDQVTAKGYPEVFRNSTAVSLIYTTIGQWLVAAGFKRVAVLSEKNDVGLAARQTIAAQLSKANVANDAVDADPSLTDFTAQILRFKSASPAYDFFFTNFSEAGAYDLVRQAKELGFALNAKCGMYNSGGSAVDPTFWQNVKQAGVYLCTENVGLPTSAWNDKTKAFAKLFNDKFKTNPPGAVMEAYDGLYLLADAIQRTGGTDGKGIISALETTSYVGARGKYSFSTSHDPAWHYHQFLEAPLTLIQYSQENQSLDGAPIVWPAQFATAKETYIRPPA